MRRSRVRLIGLLVVTWLAGWASATRVVQAPHVSVLYDDPALAPYAQQVAKAAETELVRVAAWFGREPFPIRIRLQGGDDVFNAFALPLPRPHVTFRPLFPIDGEVGFHSGDLTELVLRHEITHLVQLTDTRVPAATTPLPRIGLVGQGTAVLPPAWLLEGIATYVESEGGLGGRLSDARTRALLWTLAADGTMPSLADVSLISYQAWPGGRARYLLGSSFIAFLVKRHGFDALVHTLHTFQAGDYLLPFADAWRATVGTDLYQEWSSWAEELAATAKAHKELSVPAALTPPALSSGAPAVAPDGRTLAWSAGAGVRVATLEGNAVEGAHTVSTQVAPESLAWLDDRTVVMSAVTRDPGAYPSDLFALDVDHGSVERLTHGAHAHLPRADGNGCVLYVRDVIPAGASLRRWCRSATDTAVWTAPSGVHIVGLAVSPAGRIALSLYRPGGVDLALLGPDGVHFLTSDAASELDPSWQGEDTLWFSSDATGLFQLYRLHLPAGAVAGPGALGRPLTASLGGAEDAVATADGVLYRTLYGDGYALARWKAAAGTGTGPSGASQPGASQVGATPTSAVRGSGGEPAAARVPSAPAGSGAAAAAGPTYPDVPYSPWPSILPYGWLPTNGRLSVRPFGFGIELAALGLDDSAHHALDLTAGYDTALRGPLAGAYGSVRYAWNLPDPARAPGPPPPLGLGVSIGLWPHGAYLGPVDETAYGVRVEALLRGPVSGHAGSLAMVAAVLGAPSFAGVRPEAAVDAVLDARTVDAFGAATGGETLALRGRWSYGAGGVSAGAWGEVHGWPGLPGTAVTGRVGLSAGYRPLPPVPVTLPTFAAIASLGFRVSVPVRARWGDGLAALERLDLEPTARLWAGAQPAAGGGWTSRLGAGADLGIWADTVLDYDAVVRFGVRAGYADGWWFGLGLGLPF